MASSLLIKTPCSTSPHTHWTTTSRKKKRKWETPGTRDYTSDPFVCVGYVCTRSLLIQLWNRLNRFDDQMRRVIRGVGQVAMKPLSQFVFLYYAKPLYYTMGYSSVCVLGGGHMNICRASFFVVYLNPNFFFEGRAVCVGIRWWTEVNLLSMFLSVRTTSHHQIVRMKVSRRDFSSPFF